MNKVYRIVWNASLGCWVAVSELAKSKTKGKSGLAGSASRPMGKSDDGYLNSKSLSFKLMPLAVVFTLFLPSFANAAYNAGGGVTYSTAANTVSIGSGNACNMSSTSNASTLLGYSGSTGGAYTASDYSIAIGNDCTNPAIAAAINTLAMGRNSIAGGEGSNAIGFGAFTRSSNAIAFGTQATTQFQQNAISIGNNATVSTSGTDSQFTNFFNGGNPGSFLGGLFTAENDSSGASILRNTRTNTTQHSGGIALGSFAKVGTADTTQPHASGVAIGDGAHTFSTGVALGASATSAATAGVAIGPTSLVRGTSGVAIGRQSVAEGNFSIAQGQVSYARGVGSVAQGHSATASGANAIAIGSTKNATSLNYDAVSGTRATGDYAIALGSGSSARGKNAIILGNQANSGYNGTVVIGANSTSFSAGGISIGGNPNATDGTINFQRTDSQTLSERRLVLDSKLNTSAIVPQTITGKIDRANVEFTFDKGSDTAPSSIKYNNNTYTGDDALRIFSALSTGGTVTRE